MHDDDRDEEEVDANANPYGCVTILLTFAGDFFFILAICSQR